ncbi:MAG: hypothetical protein KDK91_19215 [Gammaproteobacteria bacterium]|nr:hypothetical protein [Gammaproteobacteria bacterium]
MSIAEHQELFGLWSAFHAGCLRVPVVRKTTRALHAVLPGGLLYRVFWLPLLLVYLLVASSKAVRTFGPGAQRLTGVPLREQLAVVLRTCFRFPGLLPVEYYRQKFYLPKYAGQIAGSGHNFDVRMISHLVCGKSFADLERDAALAHDKLTFHRLLGENGIAAAPILAVFRRGRAQWLDSKGVIPEGDLFLKPGHEDAGRGARRIFYEPASRGYSIEKPAAAMHRADPLEAFAQTRLTGDELVGLLCRSSDEVDWILMPRLRNHPHLVELAGDATLATLRIATIRDRQGRFSLFFASWRVALTDSAVDNAAQGGMECFLDPVTGRLNAGYLSRDDSFLAVHPVTGATIKGTALPWLGEAVDMCIQVHRLLTQGDRSYMFLIGFDVALTAAGPVLIEANYPGDVSGPHVRPAPLWRDPDFVRCADSFLEPLRGFRTHFHPDLWHRDRSRMALHGS